MRRFTPDPTFYAMPTAAIDAPAEKLAYVAPLHPARPRPCTIYPDGIVGWLAKVRLDGERGGMRLEPDFFAAMGSGMRAHQVRLQGGDASSDSLCYPAEAIP